MQINSKEISIVIQGAVDKSQTPILIKSIREFLPYSTIIISTWKGADVAGLDYDLVVESEDPGAMSMSVDGKGAYNINRMLKSTQAGLAQVKTKYVLKCRSDLVMINSGFLSYYDKFSVRDKDYVLANHKIQISSLYCMKAEMERGLKQETPYHISDWYCFGETEDIKELFNVPLVDITEFARYFEIHRKPRDYEIPWLNHRVWRFPPEQYLGVEYARKLFPDLTFDNCLETQDVDIIKSEKFLVNNFTILDPMQFGMVSQKEYYDTLSQRLYTAPDYIWNGIYRQNVYENDYKKYCDSAYIPRFDELKLKRKAYSLYKRYIKGERTYPLIKIMNENSYKYYIITPTYRGHFEYIKKYLKSFNEYVQDKADIQIVFTISATEFFEFNDIIYPYSKDANIRVVMFEDILRHFRINATADQLLERYGRFSFQTLKKLYTILYVNAEKSLVLDSESMWVRPTKMTDEFETFFKNPFVSYSVMRQDQRNEFVNEVIKNTNLALGIKDNGNWFLENFVWFYDIHILKDLFQECGTPIHIVEKIYQITKNKVEQPGVFEIMLYHGFIFNNASKYHYRIIDINKQLDEYLGYEGKIQYLRRFYAHYRGANGIVEQAMSLLTASNIDGLAQMFSEDNFSIIRCENSDANYEIQKRFVEKLNPCILAASQNHRFGLNKRRKLTGFGWKFRRLPIRQIFRRLPIRQIFKWIFFRLSPNYRQLWYLRGRVDGISWEIDRLIENANRKEDVQIQNNTENDIRKYAELKYLFTDKNVISCDCEVIDFERISEMNFDEDDSIGVDYTDDRTQKKVIGSLIENGVKPSIITSFTNNSVHLKPCYENLKSANSILVYESFTQSNFVKYVRAVQNKEISAKEIVFYDEQSPYITDVVFTEKVKQEYDGRTLFRENEDYIKKEISKDSFTMSTVDCLLYSDRTKSLCAFLDLVSLGDFYGKFAVIYGYTERELYPIVGIPVDKFLKTHPLYKRIVAQDGSIWIQASKERE